MRNLIILDSDLQKKNEGYYRNLKGGSRVVYTNYETTLIRKVRNFKYIGSLLYHLLMWKKSYNYAKEFIKFEEENIICLNPLVGIFLGIFYSNKNIILAGFLFEPKKNKLYYYLRKQLVYRTLKNVKNVIVYGSKEVVYYSKIFPEYKDKFKFVHYGLDYENSDTYKSNLPSRYFFSGGGSNRDYETLVRAIERSKNKISCVIATQPWRVPEHTSQITVLSDVVVETFGDVLSKAEVLILSLKDVDLSAGHMVMLQAMSLGIPIIVNDIPAVRDYVDEESVIFYPSGDFKTLSLILDNFKPDESVLKCVANAKKLYFEHYTSKKLMERLLSI